MSQATTTLEEFLADLRLVAIDEIALSAQATAGTSAGEGQPELKVQVKVEVKDGALLSFLRLRTEVAGAAVMSEHRALWTSRAGVTVSAEVLTEFVRSTAFSTVYPYGRASLDASLKRLGRMATPIPLVAATDVPTLDPGALLQGRHSLELAPEKSSD